MGFYLEYLAKWPDYFAAQEASCGRLMGYSECLDCALYGSALTVGAVQSWGKPRAARQIGMAT